MVSGRWPVARTGSYALREPVRPDRRKTKGQGRRPKTARIRFRAVPTLPEEAAPLRRQGESRRRASSVFVRAVHCFGTAAAARCRLYSLAFLPLLALSADVSPARGGDMPRGMAGAWHVTRGPIPRGPKNGMGDRASHNARSPGGLLGRYRRGLRALRQNGGLRRTEGDSPIFAAAALSGCGTSHMPRKLGQSPCPSGSRKPRIAKEQPAVAGIRACLPAALVVERISIRPQNARRISIHPRNAGRIGKSVLPAAALLSERSYTIPAGPISREFPATAACTGGAPWQTAAVPSPGAPPSASDVKSGVKGRCGVRIEEVHVHCAPSHGGSSRPFFLLTFFVADR